MIRTAGFVPCGEFLTQGQQPTQIYKRERDREADGGGKFSSAAIGYNDVWYVNTKSIDVQGDPAEFRLMAPPELAKVHYEDVVRIPLHRYVVARRDLRLLHGFAAQIGVAARDALPRVSKVLQLHLALGDVFDRQEDNQLEFYLGIAFRCLP